MDRKVIEIIEASEVDHKTSSKASSSEKVEIESVKNESFKSKYRDRVFRKQMVRAVRANFGEANNMDKIRGNKTLKDYSEEQIVEFANTVAKDIQKGVEEEIEDEDACSAFQLANLVNDISNKKKSQELHLAMKAKAESLDIPVNLFTHNVDFRDLTRFLYTSMGGMPDASKLNQESLQVLFQTHELLMERVNKDATPEFLEELKANICQNQHEDKFQTNLGDEELAKAFQDKSFNPFGFPLTFLLKGSLPLAQDEPDVNANPIQIDLTMSHRKDSEEKRSAVDVTSSQKASPEK